MANGWVKMPMPCARNLRCDFLVAVKEPSTMANSLTPLCTVGSHPATASVSGTRAGAVCALLLVTSTAVQRQTDRKVALSLKKLQVSKRSGGHRALEGLAFRTGLWAATRIATLFVRSSMTVES